MNPYDDRFPLWMPAANPAPGWAVEVGDLSPMCPISGNPQAGSTITLHLPTTNGYPEIAAVVGFARDAAAQLVGGHGDIRDMEGAVQYIARAVAEGMGCDVRYVARLVIAPPGIGGDVVQLVSGEVTP